MGTVHQLSASRETVTLGEAVAAYLRTLGHPERQGTRRVYASTYRALLAGLAADQALPSLTSGALGEWFTAQWGGASVATWDTKRGALRSLFNFCEAQGWIASATNLIRGIEHRKRPVDRSRALSRDDVETLLTREDIALRERVLWRLLYESAARSAEVLRLNIEDLDLANRRARVQRKGGAVDVITWRTGTARLLPRLIKARKSGPLFLTERKARVALPPADLDRESGRARLSYSQAAGIFAAATADCHGGPWTLHQLRHSALTHAAEEGASTATLLAYSGHTSVTSLARYARVSAEALGRWQAGRDPAKRR